MREGPRNFIFTHKNELTRPLIVLIFFIIILFIFYFIIIIGVDMWMMCTLDFVRIILWKNLHKNWVWWSGHYQFCICKTYAGPDLRYKISNQKLCVKLFCIDDVSMYDIVCYYPAERANTSIGPMRRAEVSIRCIGFFISTR